MISFEEGYARIAALASAIGSETINLEDGLGRVLSEDIVAQRDSPASDISAMDGYAICGAHDSYQIVGEISAGQQFNVEILKGQALRIFTGAKIPKGADRVVIQENTSVEGNSLRISPMPRAGDNIRIKGSDILRDFTIRAPLLLTPTNLGLVASLNKPVIQVRKKPRIAIISTGSELVMPGYAKNDTNVIASNAFALKALVETFGAKAKILPIVPDKLEDISKVMRQEVESDIVLTIGGASVGKFDFVAAAAEKAGYEIEVKKVAVRPGKPILAGRKGMQIFIGLPGNPISSMVCASVFLRSVVKGQLGLTQEFPELGQAKLVQNLASNGDRTHFMRAKVTLNSANLEAEVFSNQDSASMSVLSRSNAMVVRQPHEPAKNIGELVQFVYLSDIQS